MSTNAVLHPFVPVVIEPAGNQAIDQAVRNQSLLILRFELEFFAEIFESRNSQVSALLRDLLQLDTNHVVGAQGGQKLFGVDVHSDDLSELDDYISKRTADSPAFQAITETIDGLLNEKTASYFKSMNSLG